MFCFIVTYTITKDASTSFIQDCEVISLRSQKDCCYTKSSYGPIKNHSDAKKEKEANYPGLFSEIQDCQHVCCLQGCDICYHISKTTPTPTRTSCSSPSRRPKVIVHWKTQTQTPTVELHQVWNHSSLGKLFPRM